MNKKEENEKRKTWYGIKSVGSSTEGIKIILKLEGFNIYRKEGRDVEEGAKKIHDNRRGKVKKEEEGIIYKIQRKEYDKYI